MPFKRGPPKGSQNRLKHGRYSAVSLAQRKLVRETIRSARLALTQAQLELLRPRSVGERHMDKIRNFTTFDS